MITFCTHVKFSSFSFKTGGLVTTCGFISPTKFMRVASCESTIRPSTNAIMLHRLPTKSIGRVELVERVLKRKQYFINSVFYSTQKTRLDSKNVQKNFIVEMAMAKILSRSAQYLPGLLKLPPDWKNWLKCFRYKVVNGGPK